MLDVPKDRWLEHLEELKMYKANYRDTLVPQAYTVQSSSYSAGTLGRWVDKQRRDYRRYITRKIMKEELGDTQVWASVGSA